MCAAPAPAYAKKPAYAPAPTYAPKPAPAPQIAEDTLIRTSCIMGSCSCHSCPVKAKHHDVLNAINVLKNSSLPLHVQQDIDRGLPKDRDAVHKMCFVYATQRGNTCFACAPRITELWLHLRFSQLTKDEQAALVPHLPADFVNYLITVPLSCKSPTLLANARGMLNSVVGYKMAEEPGKNSILRNLTKEQVEAVNSQFIDRLPANCLKWLTPKQIQTCPSDMVGKLEVMASTAGVRPGLWTSWLLGYQYKYISESQIPHIVSVEPIYFIPRQFLDKLSQNQVSLLNINFLRLISNPDLIAACPKNLVCHLAKEQLLHLTPDQIPHLIDTESPDPGYWKIAYVKPEQIKFLKAEHIFCYSEKDTLQPHLSDEQKRQLKDIDAQKRREQEQRAFKEAKLTAAHQGHTTQETHEPVSKWKYVHLRKEELKRLKGSFATYILSVLTFGAVACLAAIPLYTVWPFVRVVGGKEDASCYIQFLNIHFKRMGHLFTDVIPAAISR